MSLWRDELRPSASALALVVVVGSVAALSLSRAFENLDYLLWAVPGAAVGAAFALTIGRRSLGGALLALGAAGTLTLPALFARDLAPNLLPTSAAYRFLGTLLSSGVSGVLREAAPVPVDPRYLVVIWVAGLTLGFLGGAWIVVGRPLGAVVTALGVVAFAGSVGEGPRQDLFAFLAVAATLGFLLADGRHRIVRWTRRRTSLPASLGIPTLVAACVAALAGPAALGGDDPLLDLESALRPRLVIIKPLSDIQRQLQVEPPIEVLRVQSVAPAYWRLTGLDSYRGNEWVLEARPLPAENGPLPPADPPAEGPLLRQEYRITSLLAPWLPAAYAPDRVDSPVPFEVDAGSSTLLLKGETLPGLRYEVYSRLPGFDPVRPAEPGQVSWDPDEPEALFGEIARPIVGEAATPLEMALALEAHFRAYDYDEDVDGGHTVERLQRFLDERIGYCEQFAATMTLMLRGLGVPARVGVGFLPGGFEDGEFIVSTQDAHAWVEVLLPDAGWVIFDPTPGRGDPVGGPQEEEQPEEEPAPVPEEPELEPPTPPPAEDDPQAGAPGTDGDGPPILPVLFTMLVVGALPGTKQIRRMLRRSGSAHETTVGAYEELVDRAADLGRRSTATSTEREFLRHAFESLPAPGADAARQIVEAAVFARYAAEPPTTPDAEQSWEALRPALKSLAGRTPWWRRAIAPWDPRSLRIGEVLRRRLDTAFGADAPWRTQARSVSR